MDDLDKLAKGLTEGRGSDNALDVLIEVALFEPDDFFQAVRANHAGTKVIYTRPSGTKVTCWAPDWTMDREGTLAALKAHIERIKQ